ncbi:MAG: hypothetical protein H0X25_10615 [Acidobacteriales bacterium]|nr:hypothetical protein [Terriglobales bacterium]
MNQDSACAKALDNLEKGAVQSSPTASDLRQQNPSAAHPGNGANDTHNPDRAQAAEPVLGTEDINHILGNKPAATGLHPNFVEARKRTQFKPGQSGNPGGRRRARMGDGLEDILSTVHQGDVLQRTYEDLINFALVHKGMGGDISAIRMVYERRDGKVGPAAAAVDRADRLDEIVRALQGEPEALDRVLGEDRCSQLDAVEKEKAEKKGGNS